MANIDMFGTGALGRQAFREPSLLVLPFGVAQYSPVDGSPVAALAENLRFFVDHVGGGTLTDVQLQVSTAAANFATTVYDNTLTGLASGLGSAFVGGLVSGTRYLWRLRASEAGMAAWTEWTAVWSFTPVLDASRATGYVNMNVGPEAKFLPTGIWYVDENVGVHDTRKTLANWYSDLNTGVETTLVPSWAWYGAYGDVDDSTPDPHLWFLLPSTARPGDGVQAYCFGVGDLPEEYAGRVEIYLGAAQGWVDVTVTGWQTQLPTVDAYGPARMLDESTLHIDMQHTRIEFVVPQASLPPGYPVRIRTDGP